MPTIDLEAYRQGRSASVTVDPKPRAGRRPKKAGTFGEEGGGPSSRKPRAERAPREPRPRRDFSVPPVPTCSAREAMLTCLARRDHSQKELRDRLKRQGHAPEAIEEALAYGVESGYQSDARYAASMARYKGARLGERRLRHLFQHQKIDAETVTEALAGAGDEATRAVQVLRRFENKTPDAALRQRATRFMAGRGFGFDVIRKAWKVVFEGASLDDE
jgi:regulatory protein